MSIIIILNLLISWFIKKSNWGVSSAVEQLTTSIKIRNPPSPLISKDVEKNLQYLIALNSFGTSHYKIECEKDIVWDIYFFIM